MAKELVLPKRIRNELCFRPFRVITKHIFASKYWRVTFEYSDLAGFHAAGFADPVKVFIPSNLGENLVKSSVTAQCGQINSSRSIATIRYSILMVNNL